MTAYTLQKIQHSPSLSEETYAYTALLVADGKPIGHVRNDGHGGQTFVSPFPNAYDAVAAAHAWAATLPSESFDMNGKHIVVPSSLDQWCDDQITAMLLLKDFRRELKSRVLVLVDGCVRGFRFKGQRTVTPQLLASVKRDFPTGRILNEMPEPEAFALWKRDIGVQS